MYSVIDNVHKAWRLFTRTSFHLQDADKACTIHKLIPLELKSATLFRNKKISNRYGWKRYIFDRVLIFSKHEI